MNEKYYQLESDLKYISRLIVEATSVSERDSLQLEHDRIVFMMEKIKDRENKYGYTFGNNYIMKRRDGKFEVKIKSPPVVNQPHPFEVGDIVTYPGSSMESYGIYYKVTKLHHSSTGKSLCSGYYIASPKTPKSHRQAYSQKAFESQQTAPFRLLPKDKLAKILAYHPHTTIFY